MTRSYRFWLLLMAPAIAPSPTVAQTNSTSIPACTQCSMQDFIFTFGGVSITNDTGVSGFTADSIMFTPLGNGIFNAGTPYTSWVLFELDNSGNVSLTGSTHR